MPKKALIAMSGGVDSSVAAYLMKERGYDCTGITLKLFDSESYSAADKTCCSLDDIEDARSVCRRLGIPHYVYNFKDSFAKQVIDRFVSAYENGRTPNPCIDCNRYIKFEQLFHRAEESLCPGGIRSRNGEVYAEKIPRSLQGSKLCSLFAYPAATIQNRFPAW